MSESVGASKSGEAKKVNTPVAGSIAKLAESKLKASSPTATIEYVTAGAASASLAFTSFATVAIDVFSAKFALAVERYTGVASTSVTVTEIV